MESVSCMYACVTLQQCDACDASYPPHYKLMRNGSEETRWVRSNCNRGPTSRSLRCRVRVCRGAYEAELVEAWEEWDAENTSENEHPHCFREDQVLTRGHLSLPPCDESQIRKSIPT